MATVVNPIRPLDGYKLINLTSFRKNGNPVSTPVMFAEADGKLYVVTGVTAGKVKRIANNPNVQITPCKPNGEPLGETYAARARLLSRDEWSAVKPRARWGTPAPMRFIFKRLHDLRAGGNVYLEITLA